MASVPGDIQVGTLPYPLLLRSLSDDCLVLNSAPTVLRTAYSDEADELWPAAMDRLKLWVTQYFVHYSRLIAGNRNPSANEELASRFALDVLDDAGTVAGIKRLNLPGDLLQASQEDFKFLTRIFDNWAERVIGHVGGVVHRDGELIFERGDNPRFCDFLVIDEGALRSLAALPDETPPLDIVSREERFVGFLSLRHIIP
jgi:hypothetical protein